MEALLAKAKIISAWCLFTGIEISYTKLRIFGVHWGIWRKDPPLIVYGKGWAPRLITRLRDGTLKHLGLKSDMDAGNIAQKVECMVNIRSLGENSRGPSRGLGINALPWATACAPTWAIGRKTHHGAWKILRR